MKTPPAGSQAEGLTSILYAAPVAVHSPLAGSVLLYAILIYALVMAMEGALLTLESLECSTEPLNKCLLKTKEHEAGISKKMGKTKSKRPAPL